MSSLDILNFNGAIAARGDNTQSAVNLNAFKVRNYQHNAQLNSNRQIPYLPFIVNIVSWHEEIPL